MFSHLRANKRDFAVDGQLHSEANQYWFAFTFPSHTDKLYKEGLLKTMIHRTHALSSITKAFDHECTRLRSIFVRLDYPVGLIDSTIQKVVCNSLNGDLQGIKKMVIELWSALACSLYNLQKSFFNSRKDQAFSFRMSPFL